MKGLMFMLLGLGVAVIAAYVLAWLGSARVRRLLERPGQRMLERDRELWPDGGS